MMCIRPVREADLDGLVALAEQATFGLTTLPRDRKYLARRIAQSISGFEKLDDEPRGEAYLFVMHDTDSGRVVGTCGIVSKVGGFEPFYAYRIETSVHESKTLSVRKEIPTLHLLMEHNGPCEIGSLFLAPEGRGKGNGRLLSLSRFLFMADHPTLFDPVVIAEMRGVIGESGHPPFWDAVGKHFFEVDFPTADYLSLVNKRFIAELMPRHPIYIPLLPPAAQAVIGQVHPNTAPALKMLEDEGFKRNGQVDIFEAGPVVECRRDDIRTVRHSRRVELGEIVAGPIESPPYVIGNTRRDFRACLGNALIDHDRAVLTEQVATTLQLNLGDPVRLGTIKAT